MGKDFVLSVMSLDRVGIVSEVAGAVAELGGNIDAISQTVMQGYFTIIITVHFEEPVEGERLAAAVRESGSPGELEVSVKKRAVLEPAPVVGGGERYILTLSGPDRRGIIHRICRYLASRNINIDDLYAHCEGSGFMLIAQLQVPAGLEVERLQMDVEGLWPEEQMAASLQHENIFLATNEVAFRQQI